MFGFSWPSVGWFCLTALLGAVMWATQVSPTEAKSNLSEWSAILGWRHQPEWLVRRSFDQWARYGSLAIWILISLGLGASLLQSRYANSPFGAEIRVAINSTGRGPLTDYMMFYQSSFGQTISPLSYLFYLQVTNRQDVASTINGYRLEILDDNEQWRPLPSIPIEEGTIYFLAEKSPSYRGYHEVPPMRFPKGTYRLPASSNLPVQNAIRMRMQPIFNSESQKPIPAHQTMEGWAAFEQIDGLAEIPQRTFRMTIRDSASMNATVLMKNPIASKSDTETDTSIALMWPSGPTVDLSGAHIKFYSEPFTTAK